MQEQLATLINTTVTGLGYDLWGHEYRAYGESALLRIFIDAEAGITVDDCGKVSQQLGAALDVEDLIPVAYMLEVSSPGVDRVLFTPEHYQRYVGKELKVRTHTRIEDRRNFVGILKSADDSVITILVDNTLFEIPHDSIDRGRLKFEMQASPKKGKRSGADS
ncbi:MAG: FIG000325: clustered with transcription termination protein NusA [uncultured Thiotrichaceae bacterium]|uniref:Ribosome maturation factor RimP n=1 Tax=uncultured Thiotrichaceae bacterium TaxID=298394 RepID=A0A6S6TXB5_9GAMM|nr:MAG: FIG000325: clustered with transcription termination protein NusA [uncultured Thiotrichaceae bacterium]